MSLRCYRGRTDMIDNIDRYQIDCRYYAYKNTFLVFEPGFCVPFPNFPMLIIPKEIYHQEMKLIPRLKDRIPIRGSSWHVPYPLSTKQITSLHDSSLPNPRQRPYLNHDHAPSSHTISRLPYTPKPISPRTLQSPLTIVTLADLAYSLGTTLCQKNMEI